MKVQIAAALALLASTVQAQEVPSEVLQAVRQVNTSSAAIMNASDECLSSLAGEQYSPACSVLLQQYHIRMAHDAFLNHWRLNALKEDVIWFVPVPEYSPNYTCATNVVNAVNQYLINMQ